MRARLLKLLQDLADAFWVVPALLVVGGCLMAAGLVQIERAELTPDGFWSAWIYGGGETGARTLLGAVASSSIGVAGTIFSITIAALTLASQQMGPRLLRNFTRDRGAQWTLGVLLGTFAYSLVVLRSVRGEDDGFVPHLAVSGDIVLAFWCIGMVVYFVHHMATRINVDTVVELVHRDLVAAVEALTEPKPTTAGETAPEVQPLDWSGADEICDERSGYLQQLDVEGLADWACAEETHVKLLVRPGDYLFPGAPIALVKPARKGACEAIRQATALSADRASPADLTYTVRQLVEVAVRALSPGINDPMTAISVLDRLGDALCRLAPRRLPQDVVVRDGRVLLVCAPPKLRGADGGDVRPDPPERRAGSHGPGAHGQHTDGRLAGGAGSRPSGGPAPASGRGGRRRSDRDHRRWRPGGVRDGSSRRPGRRAPAK